MKFKLFTKQKLIFISVSTLVITLISVIINVFTSSILLAVSFFIVPFVMLISYIIYDYFYKRKFYNNLIDLSLNLDNKYLLPSIIDSPDFNEGHILYEILYDCSKSMLEQVNNQKKMQEEYREYIEQWVHEIKTPLAAIYLLLENNSDKKMLKKELQSVDGYVSQVLYYARSQNPERDFFVKEFDLTLIIDEVLKKYSQQFIANKITLKYEISDAIVFADSKWSSFIIEQILNNAIKYANTEQAKISIYGTNNRNNYTLTIEDNGVGVSGKDITRIFDKGFTGENGRKFGKSTGMGLYICKSLCDKLYIGINIESNQGVGTKVNLVFPKTSLF